MLKVIRGDTNNFKFSRKDNEGNVITEMASKIFFTVKNSYNSSNIEIQKTIEDMDFNEGVYTFVIDGNDTDEMSYGTYKYDLEVVEDDYKQTISIGDFVVMEEVTFTSDEE